MFVCFFFFWAGSLPAIWFPVEKIRHLFTVKAYFVPTAGLAFFIWAIVRVEGIGPIVHQPGTLKGSALGWQMVQGIMSSIANFATLIVNDPDFARFARKPRDALWRLRPTLRRLHHLGTNIATNSVSAGTDMTALLPRYLNIRRGAYICALVGLVMCPWHLFDSVNSFTTYLSTYSVFQSSIAGVIVCDYYVVRKGYLEIKKLYSGKKSDPYYFTFGFHWRGYAADIAGILINVVGFAGAIGKPFPIGAKRLSPVPATSEVWLEVGDEVGDVSVAYGDVSDGSL
ncbi:permease for cytosine/purines, uracil, thiamine, allantoin-domain-containing protein [Phaeosphaeriaceae sp. PMI808]|nr:permease for cytosine/purines, uracil, thiamine, allantoin-domain-containing protein [Phaeosphaeriaceae sp. PMI808]